MPTAALASPRPRLPSREQRHHRRVAMSTPGRCMFEDGRETACHSIDVSLNGLALAVPRVGRVGERVIAYLDVFGRLEGRLVRYLEGGFAMAIETTLARREKIADHLTWSLNRHMLDLPEYRRHDRFVPRSPYNWLVLPDGERLRCRVVDVSPSGAAVAVTRRPRIGTLVGLGRMHGRIVRHDAEGVAVRFADVLSLADLQRDFG